jgi:hypothetical protein
VSAKRRKRRRRRGVARPASPVTTPNRGRRTESRPARAADDDRPPAPWGSFPLNEVIIFIALVMLIAAFFVKGDRAGILFAVALGLGSLATLEFAVREHFAGYRSHSLLLAGVPAVIVLGLLFYLAPEGLSPAVRVAIAAAVFATAFWLLAGAFRRRAGVSFKLR